MKPLVIALVAAVIAIMMLAMPARHSKATKKFCYTTTNHQPIQGAGPGCPKVHDAEITAPNLRIATAMLS
jgi:hypothetical protein